MATVSDYAKLSDRYHDRLAYCVITDERMLVLADVCWQNKTPPLVDGVSIALLVGVVTQSCLLCNSVISSYVATVFILDISQAVIPMPTTGVPYLFITVIYQCA